MNASHEAEQVLDASAVKAIARAAGADLAGIANAEVLNEYPPDPAHPQIPARITRQARNVIVIGKRVPVAGFRTKARAPYHNMTVMVLRRLDKIALRISQALERHGHFGVVAATNSTSWELKRGTYGHFSLRHLAVEAGLGTLGLNMNFLSPEFGPRLYLGAIMTDLDVEPDQPMREQVCIGESCARCVHGCPTDSVRHFALDKRACSPEAQVAGFSGVTSLFSAFVKGDRKSKEEIAKSPQMLAHWQSMMRVAGCFACCPRCSAVCPVGDDYHAHLAEISKVIPEKTPEKIEKAGEFKVARKMGDGVVGLNEWNVRWVGPDGYTGEANRQQRKKHKAEQQHKMAAAAAATAEQDRRT